MMLCMSPLSLVTDTTSYPLSPITAKELMKLRLGKKPTFVYKKGTELYYTHIPNDLKVSQAGFEHICKIPCDHVCKCARTLDLTPSYQSSGGKKFPNYILDSWRIEKYDFITEGIETFNMKGGNESFLVFKCNKFITPPTRHNGVKKADLKLGLASFWCGFEGNYKELRQMISNNLDKNSTRR